MLGNPDSAPTMSLVLNSTDLFIPDDLIVSDLRAGLVICACFLPLIMITSYLSFQYRQKKFYRVKFYFFSTDGVDRIAQVR